ncbi:MAG TPA: FAD-dependent oxidoreductase [Anaerolineales bacterium]|nr:FAD-dependent oxidoreductase [Anaerolineales bacterium]
MSTTADVIIIGAGVQGASLAFHLAQRGVKALVLEKKFVAAGATGRSSGLVRMHYDVRQDTELAWLSFQYFRNWKEMVGGECGFTRTGFVQLVGPSDIERLKANVAMHRQLGVPEFLIDGDDLKRLAPSFSTEDVEVAAYEPESGYAMPSDTANALLNAARAKGAQLVQDCAVTEITAHGGRVSGVETSQGAFSAPIVVNAAGAWAGRLNDIVGLDLPYDTWRHETMFVVRPPQVGPAHPTVIDFTNEMYFRPEGSLTLIGLEDGNPLGESPDSDADHARPGFVERGIDRICRRIPAMEYGGLHSAHAGYDGITPDQHPMLGAAGPDGFYLDCGFSGTGFKTAPAVGLCMSELILDGQAKTIDISVFSPHRFAEDKPIAGPNGYGSQWH